MGPAPLGLPPQSILPKPVIGSLSSKPAIASAAACSLTIDPATKVPVEFGAEFVHGKPDEIWDLIRKHKLKTTEVDGDMWCFREGRLQKCDFFSQVDDVLGNLSDDGPDQSFVEYLNTRHAKASQEARQWALGYVEGFHAADPDLVSMHSLVRSNQSEEEIEGDRSFHLAGGYATLLAIWEHQVRDLGVKLHLDTPVKSVSWKKGRVETDAGVHKFAAAKAVVTLPLPLLQHDDVKFCPALPAQKLDALRKLAMGHVIRVALCFRQRFWAELEREGKSLEHLSFLFSRDEWFPTWWTRMPEQSPVITGWAPFPSAERLSGKPQDFVVDKSLESLGRLLGVAKDDLRGMLGEAYVHDWQSDPYSRGAYSYVKVGGDHAAHDLGAPLENTLFFAGEATDAVGNNGTVNGAIASGRRVAREVFSNSGVLLPGN